MRDSGLIIIGVMAIVFIGLIAGVSLLANANNHANNTTNDPDNTTINLTENNTTENNKTDTTAKKSTTTSTKKSTEKKNSSSSSEDTINGEKITERHDFGGDSDIEYIGTDDNIYLKNKKTGDTVKRHLDDDGVYRFY